MIPCFFPSMWCLVFVTTLQMQFSAVFIISRSITVVLAGWGNSKRDTRVEQGYTAYCLTAVTCRVMLSNSISLWVFFITILIKDHLVPTSSTFPLFHSTHSHSFFQVFYGSQINEGGVCVFVCWVSLFCFVHITNPNVLLGITFISHLGSVSLKE